MSIADVIDLFLGNASKILRHMDTAQSYDELARYYHLRFENWLARFSTSYAV
jgi:hypothetical protein